MSRIRTRRQARKLRPIATERARHSKFKVGEVVFYHGYGWYPALVIIKIERKPYRIYVLQGAVQPDGTAKGGMFYTSGVEVFSDVHAAARAWVGQR